MTNRHDNNSTRCRVCEEIMNTRVKRNPLIRTLLFWLPIKVYFCQKCVSKRYVFERRHSYSKVKTA